MKLGRQLSTKSPAPRFAPQSCTGWFCTTAAHRVFCSCSTGREMSHTFQGVQALPCSCIPQLRCLVKTPRNHFVPKWIVECYGIHLQQEGRRHTADVPTVTADCLCMPPGLAKDTSCAVWLQGWQLAPSFQTACLPHTITSPPCQQLYAKHLMRVSNVITHHILVTFQGVNFIPCLCVPNLHSQHSICFRCCSAPQLRRTCVDW